MSRWNDLKGWYMGSCMRRIELLLSISAQNNCNCTFQDLTLVFLKQGRCLHYQLLSGHWSTEVWDDFYDPVDREEKDVLTSTTERWVKLSGESKDVVLFVVISLVEICHLAGILFMMKTGTRSSGTHGGMENCQVSLNLMMTWTEDQR